MHVADVAQLLFAFGSIVSALASLIAAWHARAARVGVEHVGQEVNGRMSQLLAETEARATAETLVALRPLAPNENPEDGISYG